MAAATLGEPDPSRQPMLRQGDVRHCAAAAPESAGSQSPPWPQRPAGGLGCLRNTTEAAEEGRAGCAHSDSEPERECEPLLQPGQQGSASKSSSSSGPRSPVAPRARSKCSLAPVPGLLWLAGLREHYGANLLLLLFASQHVLKGIVCQFQGSAVMWVFREYRLSGPRIQVYASIANSAWALKPIIGLTSDLAPIGGYRKAPYVVLVSIIGVGCTAYIGFSTSQTASVLITVACLFGMSLQAATCDLLTEAKYSEHLARKPAFGPDLLTYVWAGASCGNIIALALVGWIIANLGPRFVFLTCIAPAAAVLYPTLLNYFEEVRLTEHARRQMWDYFMRQKEIIGLCILMFVATIFLTIVGAGTNSHTVQFAAAVLVLVVLLPSFHVVLRPEIAKVNTFFVLQAAFGVGIGGATFYFYTDRPDQFPEGPHFSVWFFTTALGLVSSFMSLVGLATYSRYMKSWSYRSLTLFSNVVVACLSLLDMLMYTRMNRRLGIPDVAFVLGSSVSTIVVRQWQWMPGIVLLSQLCPTGMEATMYALLAGCSNIGNTIADYTGAFVLSRLHVHPTGAADEGHQFEHLWVASCIASLLPALTIGLIPYLIPDAKQTDRLLLEEPTSAIVGSPFDRWLRVRRQRAATVAHAGADAAADHTPGSSAASSGGADGRPEGLGDGSSRSDAAGRA